MAFHMLPSKNNPEKVMPPDNLQTKQDPLTPIPLAFQLKTVKQFSNQASTGCHTVYLLLDHGLIEHCCYKP